MRLSIRKINIFIFGLYNMLYTLYMTELVSRNIYIFSLGMFIGILILEDLGGVLKKRKFIFKKEFKLIITIAVLFYFISLVTQLLNGEITLYLYEELLYFILPILIAFSSVNFNKKEDIKLYFYIIFIKLLAYFIIKSWGNFSMQAILNINLSDSNSSVFEMVIAHDFLFMIIIFIFLENLKAATLSFIACFLCFKRLPFLLSIIVWGGGILEYFFRKIGIFKIKLRRVLMEKISTRTRIITFLIFILISIFIMWIYTSEGNTWFINKFGISLDKVTSGRSTIINYALENYKFNGLGSSDYCFKVDTYKEYSLIGNMHCDVIKLSKEITIIGYLIYLYILNLFSSRSKILYFMFIYLFLEMVVSHQVDNLNIWIMYYLFAAYIYILKKDDRRKNERIRKRKN